VFENDFGALDPAASPEHWEQGMLQAEQLPGACRVLCFSPRHDLTLSGMPTSEVGAVVDLWATQTTELGSTYRWVQIFENRGALMGASNPHPHGQIWAVGALPREAQREDAAQERYARSTGRSLLVDYAAMESGGPRIVAEDDDWLAAVPFWAAWPFESILIPRHPIHRLAELSDQEREGLARSLRSLLNRYDRLFDRPFPYSMGWHQAPFVREAIEHWQLHAHIYPPLLRPTVRKFMVGYELLAEPQRDLTPEDAADQLRAVEVLSEVSATALNQTPGRQGGSARRPVDPETHPHSTVK
jgi:UDPglucose--hexose-1-phosphate uridylyltransferase